jgi:hypothetical protein
MMNKRFHIEYSSDGITWRKTTQGVGGKVMVYKTERGAKIAMARCQKACPKTYAGQGYVELQYRVTEVL